MLADFDTVVRQLRDDDSDASSISITSGRDISFTDSKEETQASCADG